VTDFGLARRKTPEDATTQQHGDTEATARILRSIRGVTATVGLAGTPAYMAPEQHLRGEISEAADQFSFCVALYEALYQQHPFCGTDPVSLSTSVVDNMRRPKAVETPRVPWRIRRAIERGLGNDPDRRWPSMKALLAQLGRGPIIARRRRLVGAGITAVGVSAALAVWATDVSPMACRDAERHFDGVWDDARRTDVREAFAAASSGYTAETYDKVKWRLDAYAARWVRMRTESCEATAHGEQSQELLDQRSHCLDTRLAAFVQLVDVFVAADPEVVMFAPQAVLDLPPLSTCSDVASLQTAYGIPTSEQRPLVDEAQQLRTKADALRGAGKLRDGLVVAEDAMRKAEEAGYAPEVAWARYTLSQAHAGLGNAAKAEELGLQVLVDARQAADLELEAIAWIHLLRVVSRDPRRHDEARRWMKVAQAAIDRAGDSKAHAGALAQLEGGLAAAEGHLDRAAARFEYAVDLAIEASGPDSPQAATATSKLAVILTQGPMQQRARETCALALERLGRAFGDRHPEILEPARACAELERRMGNNGKAKQLYARAYATATDTYGRRHEEVARALVGLASLHLDERELAEAEALQRDALSIAEQAVGEADALVGEIRAALAATLREQGQAAEALEQAEQAVAILHAALGEDHPRFADALAGLGRINHQRGELVRAHKQLQQAIGQVPEGSPAAQEYRAALASVLLDKQEGQEALELLSQVVASFGAAGLQPRQRAEVLFLYAKAIVSSGGTLQRAVAIASEARTLLLTAGSPGGEELAEIEAWLADHRAR
jgi:hypothetical protein